MEKNDSVIKGAKLLLEGAKMLQTPCPQCKTPIYELKNKKLICTLCNQYLIREGEIKKEEPNSIFKLSPVRSKIKQLSNNLDEETDPKKIIELSKLIKELEKIDS